jgi:probable F420-dependent oxidoreductase
MRDVAFGVNVNAASRPADILAQACHVEALGFEGVWLGEHLLQPSEVGSAYPYGASPLTVREDCYDPAPILAAIAAQTTTLMVSTGIHIQPLRNPLFTARTVATMHLLTGGRFRLGIGAGWAKEEFETLDIPFEERGPRTEEAIAVLRKALAGGDFEHQGRFYHNMRAHIVDRPTPVPIVMGGTNPAALRRAAQLCDGWLSAPDATVEENITMRNKIMAIRADSVLAGAPFTTFIRAPRIAGDEVKRYTDAGITNIVISGRQVFNASISLDDAKMGFEQMAKDLGILPR